MGLLDDITGALGGGAVGKIGELVDDLWDDRKKILELVNTLWDKRDELVGVVGWVRDHGDEVLDLVSTLPQLLGQAGDGLGNAGQAVQRASTFLTSEGDGVSVADLTGTAATALARAQEQIRSASDVFAKLGDQFDSLPLMDKPAGKVREGAGLIAGFAQELAELGTSMADLGQRVTDAGKDLHDVGGSLNESGTALHAFAAVGKGKAAKPGKAAATEPQTIAALAPTRAVKKATVKKAPAKKVAAKKRTAKKAAKAKKA
jgi:hypothetical protein